METLREWLYPLGFLSSLMFGTRVLVQWMTSEVKRKSVVPNLFWKLSLAGNSLLFLHSLIQFQFHVCLIQACNGVISWRNLNLMGPSSERASFDRVVQAFGVAIGGTTLFFLVHSLFFASGEWFRIPIVPGLSHFHEPIPFYWHAIGFVGLALFNSRFWVQWWHAEKEQKSRLDTTFWWLSLAGDLICLLYFLRIQDPVNLVGPALGVIPYIRNLILIRRNEPST